MNTFLRKTAALIWLALPAFLLSALIHMADPEINGWKGLGSYSVFWSVALLGVLVCGCVCFCFGALLNSGRSAFLGVTALFSLFSGLVLTIMGSGANSTIGHFRSLAGCTGLVFLIVFSAVIPAAVLGWPRALFGRRNGIHA